jgi:O-antigen ligase
MKVLFHHNCQEKILVKNPIHDIFKMAFVVLVIISSVSYFKITFLSTDQIYILQFATLAIVFCIILFQNIYWHNKLNKHHFALPIVLIFTGIFLSMLMAKAEHGQPVFISLWAQRILYFYLFYYALHILQISVNTLEKIIFYAGLVYVIVFFIQYAAYPRVIFAVRQGIERGTIRIFMPGLTLMNLAYFMGLVKVLFYHQFKQIPFLILFMSIYILTGTRSIIAGPLLITLFVLLLSKKIKSKGFFLVLIVGILAVSYYMFQDIIQNLVSLTSEQGESHRDNIRYQAARFFLTDFFPNQLAYVTGNGEGHQASPFGREIFSYKANYGFYQSDIGIIGEYTKYGAFFLLGVFLLLCKALTQNLTTSRKYIHYFVWLMIISLPLGSFFTSADSIVIICMLAYIMDIEKKANKHVQAKEKHKPLVFFPGLDAKSQGLKESHR